MSSATASAAPGLDDELPLPPAAVSILSDSDKELAIVSLEPYDAVWPDWEVTITVPHGNPLYKRLIVDKNKQPVERRGWLELLAVVRSRHLTCAPHPSAKPPFCPLHRVASRAHRSDALPLGYVLDGVKVTGQMRIQAQIAGLGHHTRSQQPFGRVRP